MPTILYSSNSKHLSRFQRKAKLSSSSSDVRINRNDSPFLSDKKMDSKEYLIDLCSSIYPKSVHSEVARYSETKLAIHAIVALICKNFICSWYGEKIATKDTELVSNIYQLFDDIIDNARETTVDWEQIILDDLPMLIETHIVIMRKVINEKLCLEDFYQLHLYKHTYPHSLTAAIIQNFDNGSKLQSAFMQDFVGDFLLDKLVEKLAEPFIVVDLIRSICNSIQTRKEEKSNTSQTSNWFQKIYHLFANFQIYGNKVNKEEEKFLPSLPITNNFFDHYIFGALSRCLQLESRKPLLFLALKALQVFSNNVEFINSRLTHIFHSKTLSIVSRKGWMSALWLKMRHLLFPHDNKLGPSKEVPTVEEFEQMKKDASLGLQRVARLINANMILGITDVECDSFIAALTYDKNMNKFMLQRLIDYLVTSLPVVSTSSNTP